MLQTPFSLLRITCELAFMSALLFHTFSGLLSNKAYKKVQNFFQQHRIIAGMYIIAMILGMIFFLISITFR